MNIRVVKVIAVGVAAGILGAKGIEFGAKKAVGKGKEVFDKRVRKIVKEES